MTKRKKARAVVVEAAAAAAAAAAPWQQRAPAADNASSRIAAPADRSTVPVVGLLPEAAQLGCLPGPETALIATSLVGSLVGSTRWSTGTGMPMRVGCGFFPIFRAHTTSHNQLQTMPVKNLENTTFWEKYEGPRTNQPTEVYML